jgi:chemotaxis protein CheY-P-specific phosphatase CheC
MAIARAEKAEQAAAERIKESIAEVEAQRAVESAVQLEQFTDAMKQMEGSTSTGMRQQLNLELKRLTHTQNEWTWMMQMHDIMFQIRII